MERLRQHAVGAGLERSQLHGPLVARVTRSATLFGAQEEDEAVVAAPVRTLRHSSRQSTPVSFASKRAILWRVPALQNRPRLRAVLGDDYVVAPHHQVPRERLARPLVTVGNEHTLHRRPPRNDTTALSGQP